MERIRKNLASYKTIKYLRCWVFIILAVISLILFEEVVDDVFSDPVEGDFEAQNFDRTLFHLIRRYETPAINQVMTDLTALGSVSVITTLFLILVSVLVSYRDWKGITYLSTVLLGAAIIPHQLKNYFARPRPDLTNHLVQVHDMSFPSGHSFGATCLYLALAYYSGKYARTWAEECYFYLLGFLVIMLVGLSRIYLGVHYPTDVLGGITSGAAWGFIVSAFFEYLRQKRRSL